MDKINYTILKYVCFELHAVCFERVKRFVALIHTEMKEGTVFYVGSSLNRFAVVVISVNCE
jgi:hypothetical protein